MKAMLDKHTFGQTPAAIYLAARLNEINNSKFTRKIAAQLTYHRKMIGEIKSAHSCGSISTQTLGFFCEILRVNIHDSADTMLNMPADYRDDNLPDELAVNLMVNIVTGEIKSVKRRAAKVKLLEKEQQRVLATVKPSYLWSGFEKSQVLLGEVGVRKQKIQLHAVKDPITPKTLIKKSKAKIKRIGAPDTLY